MRIPPACVAAARAAVAMAVSVTFAVFTYCARTAILDELANWQGKARELPSLQRFVAVTYAWVAAIAAAAICVPNMGVVVSIVGNLSTLFMFHFPGLCLIASAHGQSDAGDECCGATVWRKLLQFSDLAPGARRQVATGWLFIVVGTFVFVLGLTNALYSLM